VSFQNCGQSGFQQKQLSSSLGLSPGSTTKSGFQAAPATACVFNNQPVSELGIMLYQQANPANGVCVSEIRKCINGVLSGSFTSLTCTATTANPAGCATVNSANGSQTTTCVQSPPAGTATAPPTTMETAASTPTTEAPLAIPCQYNGRLINDGAWVTQTVRRFVEFTTDMCTNNQLQCVHGDLIQAASFEGICQTVL
jgi:hypothetical protein